MAVLYRNPCYSEVCYNEVEVRTVAMIYIVFSVMAAASIANIVKSSLGPVGLDKMLVDDIGVSLALETKMGNKQNYK